MASGGIMKFLFGMLRIEEVYGWSAAVLAPLDGEVVASHDGVVDRQRLIPLLDVPASFVRPLLYQDRLEKVAGNHLVLSTTAGFILLAHLRQGSLTAGEGDDVQTGQPLGQVGNSGNSMAPHLHVQLMDGPDPFTSNLTPFRLSEFECLHGEAWERQEDAALPNRATRIRFSP